MPLSHFGEFDCDSTANQFAAQSQRSLRGVAEHGESSANALRIDFNQRRRKKKIIHFHDKKARKIKEKNFI